MAAFFALRTEMRAVVLRGVQRLREIEIAHECVLLEARMVVATSLDETFDGEGLLAQKKSGAACTTISDAWSDEERELRRRYGMIRRG